MPAKEPEALRGGAESAERRDSGRPTQTQPGQVRAEAGRTVDDDPRQKWDGGGERSRTGRKFSAEGTLRMRSMHLRRLGVGTWSWNLEVQAPAEEEHGHVQKSS